MYRNKNYNKIVAETLLKSVKARRSYLLTSIEDFGISPVEALREAIQKMGINEFSYLSGIPRISVSRFVNGSDISKITTLDEYLEPFGLQTEIGLKKVVGL